MEVTCKYTALDAIPDERLRRHVCQYVHMPEILLVPGRKYRVYGVVFWEGVPWFYLCEDAQSEYPIPYCAVFFHLDDMTIPADWIMQWDGHSSSIVPRWWAEMPHFLERLVDGDEEALRIFLDARAALE